MTHIEKRKTTACVFDKKKLKKRLSVYFETIV